MTSRLAKRSLTALIAVVVVGIGLVVALPFIASTQIVRDRIAREFGIWSGYRVSLGGAPKIEVWPTIRAELPNVVLSGWGAGEGQPVLTSERVDIDLSAIAALRGKIVPVRVRFTRPLLRVTRKDGQLPVPQSPAGGKIRRAIETARVAVDENPVEPDRASLPSESFGTVEFADATVIDAADDRELLTGVTGVLEWPNLNRGLSLRASGAMNGEALKIEAGINNPLLLFAGSSAEISLALDSTPLKASFKGFADIRQPVFIDGTAQISTPSLRKLLAWTGSDIESTEAVGKASLSGRIKGEVGSVKIEDAQITVGESPGMGVIEVALGGSLPAVSGTLAFEKLDLVSFLSALAILPASPNAAGKSSPHEPFGQFNLDLRLSARNAAAGTAALTSVAAAVQITEKLATFDISDATGFGGNISTGIRIDRERERETGEFRFLATGIDSRAMAAAAGFERMVPQARGKISVILNGPLVTPGTFFRSASGSISATFDTGTIAGIDVAAFMKRASKGGFFALEEVAGGTLAFNRAELKASVARGVATIEKAEAATAGELVSLTGIVPYIGRSLALSGIITDTKNTDKPPPATTFFIGGSWDAPFISAVLPPVPLE